MGAYNGTASLEYAARQEGITASNGYVPAFGALTFPKLMEFENLGAARHLGPHVEITLRTSRRIRYSSYNPGL